MLQSKPQEPANIDPFLLKKWERVFNAFFDRNCTNAIDWGDFYVVTRRMREIYGAESWQVKYANESLKVLWEGLLRDCDENKDKVIQLSEWVHMLARTDPNDKNSWFQKYMTFIFKLFDVSADARLDLAEYTDGMNCYGFTTNDAHKAFHLIATDNYGHEEKSIAFETFKRLWREYFYSTEKKDHGNYLFGDFLSEEEEKKE